MGVAGLFFGLPVIMIIVWMLTPLKWFKFNYTIFGRYYRTPAPEYEEPQKFSDWEAVFWQLAQWETFLVYPSGLEFRVLGIGKGFVPLGTIVRLGKSGWGYGVVHSSPEIRNPLFVPKSVFNALTHAVEGNIK